MSRVEPVSHRRAVVNYRLLFWVAGQLRGNKQNPDAVGRVRVVFIAAGGLFLGAGLHGVLQASHDADRVHGLAVQGGAAVSPLSIVLGQRFQANGLHPAVRAAAPLGVLVIVVRVLTNADHWVILGGEKEV